MSSEILASCRTTFLFGVWSPGKIILLPIGIAGNFSTSVSGTVAENFMCNLFNAVFIISRVKFILNWNLVS